VAPPSTRTYPPWLKPLVTPLLVTKKDHIDRRAWALNLSGPDPLPRGWKNPGSTWVPCVQYNIFLRAILNLAATLWALYIPSLLHLISASSKLSRDEKKYRLRKERKKHRAVNEHHLITCCAKRSENSS